MKRVLIIDDAATVRMYHRNTLEAGGLGVEEAVNGIEALEKALQQRDKPSNRRGDLTQALNTAVEMLAGVPALRRRVVV